jgi:hypothetical protein
MRTGLHGLPASAATGQPRWLASLLRAYPLLVIAAAATRELGVVGGLLALLTRLPNEQDPVRCAALQNELPWICIVA